MSDDQRTLSLEELHKLRQRILAAQRGEGEMPSAAEIRQALESLRALRTQGKASKPRTSGQAAIPMDLNKLFE